MTTIATSDHWLLPLLTGLAVIGITAIPLIQTDVVSRQILSAKNLQNKRLASYKYRWEKHATKALLQALQGCEDYLEILVHEEQLVEFIEKCLQGTPQVIAIGIDEHLASREVCIWIQMGKLVYQVALKRFSSILADKMESRITTTAFCFITDASGGLGTQIVTTVLSTSDLNVPVIREPVWMAQFALLMEEGCIQSRVMEKCLFGLIRLEANAHSAKTVCFTLPGQAVTASLAPMFQCVFPCERHVFIYDGCATVVGRTLRENKLHADSPTIREFKSPIRHSTPMNRSLSKKIIGLSDALKHLPAEIAGITESWMTAVDAYFRLKADEKTNEYLPFACKIPFLLSLGTRAERDLALTNLLQYITGSRSRPLPPGAMENARSALGGMGISNPPELPAPLQKAVEDCVFRHKSILIGDKTLIDTVLPSTEWTLKSAKKISGCACCAPEDDDEDLYNPSTGMSSKEANSTDINEPGAFAMAFNVNRKTASSESKYVDGKLSFAFDPNKFA